MYEEIKNYIPIKDLKDGYIYNIKARNANYGVWIEEKSAFMISRWKFNANYLFLEIHWDADELVGTVKPIEILEKFKFQLKEILAYLDSLDDSLKNAIHKSFSEIPTLKTSIRS